MGKIKKVAASTAAALIMLGGGVTAAEAATQYVGGGVWNYGVGGGKVYSDYFHKTLGHGSSVVGKSGLVQSPCVPKGRWARASDNTSWLKRGQAFWRHC